MSFSSLFTQRLFPLGVALGLMCGAPSANAVNVALNATAVGLPSPLASDPGVFSGVQPWDLVDGQAWYSDWQRGLAMDYGGQRQYTITLDQRYAFDTLVLWHHPNLVGAGYNIPVTVNVEVYDSGAWQAASFSRTVDLNAAYPAISYGAYSDTYVLSGTPAGTAVRWSYDGAQTSWSGQAAGWYAWLYEFEVHGVAAPLAPVPEPHAIALALVGLGLLGRAAQRRKSQAGTQA